MVFSRAGQQRRTEVQARKHERRARVQEKRAERQEMHAARALMSGNIMGAMALHERSVESANRAAENRVAGEEYRRGNAAGGRYLARQANVRMVSKRQQQQHQQQYQQQLQQQQHVQQNVLQNLQLAMPPGHTLMMVTCPPGFTGGMNINVSTAQGPMQVTVPMHIVSGQTFHFAAPVIVSPPLAVATPFA